MLLEICASSLHDALTAQDAGGDRIELCADASVGGVTPSAGVIETARELLSISLFVMIRPRGGAFIYTDAELAAMKRDIALCRSLKADGIVLGVLDANNNVDRKTTVELVQLAKPMDVTFHRAFDLTPDPTRALEDVIAAGCTRLLTSGHQATAVEGASEIAALIAAAQGRIAVMPGSGVRSHNLAELVSLTGAKEFHSSARTKTSSTPANKISQSFSPTDSIDAREIQQLRCIADASPNR